MKRGMTIIYPRVRSIYWNTLSPSTANTIKPINLSVLLSLSKKSINSPTDSDWSTPPKRNASLSVWGLEWGSMVVLMVQQR